MIRDNIIYPVTVDYDLPLENLLKYYTWRASDITPLHFPPTRNGIVTLNVELPCFDQPIRTPDVLQAFARSSYSPLGIHELIAFDRQYPLIQYQFPLLALGSLWEAPDHQYRFPYSHGWRWVKEDGEDRFRFLYLYSADHLWGTNCRFPAVHA